jgi:hypothetical protein
MFTHRAPTLEASSLGDAVGHLLAVVTVEADKKRVGEDVGRLQRTRRQQQNRGDQKHHRWIRGVEFALWGALDRSEASKKTKSPVSNSLAAGGQSGQNAAPLG